MKLTKEKFKYIEGGEKVNYNDEINDLYGCEFAEIDLEDIEHLKKGGVLRFSVNDEYVLLLRINEVCKENE